MVKKAIYASLKAKPGKEADVEAFLNAGLDMVEQEPGTVTWYALKEGEGMYSIFDTFDDDDGRDTHLNGAVASALMEKADDLFSEPPAINKIDVLAAKLKK